MARVFITGSADGLGLLAGKQLVEQGHDVVLHARNDDRAAAARSALPRCRAVAIGDVSTLAAMHAVAEQVNARGPFDAVVHNVGIGDRESRRVETEDGLPHVFAINVVAPYVLTALVRRPARLIYLGSDMHVGGDASLNDLKWTKRSWSGAQAYADSKLYDVMLALAIARHWPCVSVNAVDPGWVPTRMGGPGAPDDLAKGAATQAWLATSDEAAARETGRYLFHRKPTRMNPAAGREQLQDRLLAALQEITGLSIP